MRKALAVSILLILAVAVSLPQTIMVRHWPPAGGGSPDATFVDSGYNVSAAQSTTIATSSTVDIQAGDVLVVCGFGQYERIVSVSCGSNTLSEIKTNEVTGQYYGATYALMSATSAGSTACTATFNSVGAPYRAIGAGVWRPSTSPGSSVEGSTCHDASCSTLSSTTANRTAQNYSQTGNDALHVFCGVDYDGPTTHTATNGYTNRINSIDADSVFMYDKVVHSSGSYPGGNIGTVSPSDEYTAMFTVIDLP